MLLPYRAISTYRPGYLLLSFWLGSFFALLLTPELALAAESDPATRQLEAYWARSDRPVVAGLTRRPLLWGATAPVLATERWLDADRQQISSRYYSNGVMSFIQKGSASQVVSQPIVRDLLFGITAQGSNSALLYESAQLPVAGDANNPLAITPTYADYLRVLTGRPYPQVGLPVALSFDGKRVERREPLSPDEPAVNIVHYEAASGHNIPAPFWEFFQQQGLVATPDGNTAEGALMEWQDTIGYPLTEPYYIKANFGNAEDEAQEVIAQLYFKRVLLYFPATKTVELAQVGADYYRWRYGKAPVATGDLGRPPSVNGSIKPGYGGANTIFNLSANGFAPDEEVKATVFKLNSSPREYPLDSLNAEKDGRVRTYFFGGSLVYTSEVNGVYRLTLRGAKSGNKAVLYYRLITAPPVTPTTPIVVDRTPVPASTNAAVAPTQSSPGGLILALVDNIQLKDIISGKVAVWVTPPGAPAFGIDPLESNLLVDGEELLEGSLLTLVAPTLPGIWGITFQRKDNPAVRAIVYFKVTGEPQALSLGRYLDPYTRGLPFAGKIDRATEAKRWYGKAFWQPRPTQKGGK